MVHGVRKGVARGVSCPQGKGMSFTSWDAAESALVRLGAERVYRCSGCGHLHITRYTEGEYSQRIAATDEQGCTSGIDYGIVVDTDEGENDEAKDAATAGDDGGEPRPDAGGPRATTFKRGPSPRPAPSPATFARILKERGDPGRRR